MAAADQSDSRDSGRIKLYETLSLLEDWFRDGFHCSGELPDFAELPASRQSEPAQPQKAQEPATPQGDSLEAIHHEVTRCLKCRLAGSRSRTVPGAGTRKPLVLIIGEAPDQEDNQAGLPFSGPGGVLLDKMLAAIRLQRDQHCYLTHVVKCYPPNGRDPAPDEQRCCAWYLERQIKVLQPRAILALGRIPAQLLLDSRDSLQRLRGRLYDVHGIPCVVSHSINNLLKDESLKRPAWEDLKLLLQLLPNG